MTSPLPADRPKGAPGGWGAPLATIFAVQVTAGFMLQLLPTTAPALMAQRGWSEGTIGYLSALIMSCSIVVLLACGPLLRRFGPLRVIQVQFVVGAFGALLLGLPAALAPLATCFLLGSAYGPTAPAGSDILHRFSPPRHHALIFSIRQAGVPLGAAGAGLVLPLALSAGGLAAATGVTAAVLVGCACLVQPMRRRADADRVSTDRTPLGMALGLPFKAIWGLRDLRGLAAIGGFLAVGQGVLNAFLVTFLVTTLSVPLESAGLIFAAMHGGGIVGRLLAGWLADRLRSGLAVLRIAAIGGVMSSLCLSVASQDWSLAVWLVPAAATGVFVFGWNGVLMSEVARRASVGTIGETTAGATTIIYLGLMLGPAGFAAVHGLLGGFNLAFVGFGAWPALAILLSIVLRPRATSSS